MKPNGSIALVTGASSGIGKALAFTHAENGGHLIITARRRLVLESLKSELESRFGIRVFVVVCDLLESGSAKKLFEKIKNFRKSYADKRPDDCL